MDGAKTETMNVGGGTVDAAALAKAALAAVSSQSVAPAAEPQSVAALQAQLAELKAKLAAGPEAAKPPKAVKAAKAAKPPKAVKVKAAKVAKTPEAEAPLTHAQATALIAKYEGKKGRRSAAFYEAQKLLGVESGAKTEKAPKLSAEKQAAKDKKTAAKEARLAAKQAKKDAKEKTKAEKLAAKQAKKDAKEAKGEKTDSTKEAVKTGQTGAPIKDLTADRLNEKETAIMLALGTEGHRTDKSIETLAAECYPQKKKAQANSWIRNGLRRLVRAKLLEKDARGVFKQSLEGRNVAKKLEELKAAAK